MMRQTVIAGNWKMNKTRDEINTFVTQLEGVQVTENVEAIICAPFLYIPLLDEKLQHTKIKLGAQNMHAAENGAFTGEVSPLMLKDFQVSHVIIGHSERRQYFNETDAMVNEKVIVAHKHQFTPIVCVGESLEQREANETLAVIERQVIKALEQLTEEQISETIIAYEPIWAIGTGKTATSADANEVCGHIRHVIGKLTTPQVAERVIIQYGGSVNEANIDELLSTAHIDGALVGGASLDANSFKKLIEAGMNK